jgi:uncharacterized Fe-S cluster-containing MiaB family protein
MLRGSDRSGSKYPYMEVMETNGRIHVWHLLVCNGEKKTVFNCSKFDVELHQDIQPLPLNQKIKTRNASLQL